VLAAEIGNLVKKVKLIVDGTLVTDLCFNPCTVSETRFVTILHASDAQSRPAVLPESNASRSKEKNGTGNQQEMREQFRGKIGPHFLPIRPEGSN